MRALAAVALGVLFVVGAILGAVLGMLFFWIAVFRAGRAVHNEGVVCRAELLSRDPLIGPKLAGPTLVRLSGAFTAQHSAGRDVLGLLLRLRPADQAHSDDHAVGDQDLLLGTFESFRTASRDRAATDVTDYLSNRYSTVTPWWLAGHGPAILRLTAASASVTSRRNGPASASSIDAHASDARAVTRIDRLDAAIAADRARMILVLDCRGSSTEIAELRLIERMPIADRRLHASMFRCKRGLRPVGFRNGIRATLYPMSQFGRWLRVR
jgi:hypothetical protein